MLGNQSWGLDLSARWIGTRFVFVLPSMGSYLTGCGVRVAWGDCLILSWVILPACSFFSVFSWCFLMSFLFLVLWLLSLIPWSLFLGLWTDASLICNSFSLLVSAGFASGGADPRLLPSHYTVPYDQVSFSWSIIYPHSRTIKVWAGGPIDLSNRHPTSRDLKSDDLSLDFVRDGILIQANLKPSSIQIGSGSMVFHQPWA